MLRILVAALAVVFVHLPALKTGYVYDDVEAILENKDLHSFSNAGSIFFVHYWGEFKNIGLYRPFVQLTYLVDGAGFGFDPWVSHALQLMIHVLALLAGAYFFRRVGVSSGATAAAVFLIGVHPALLDASVWISGRTDTLSALFVLLGLGLAVDADRQDEGFWRLRTVLLSLCYLLGLFSKEMAVTLPLLVLLLPGTTHRRRLPLQIVAFAIYLAFRASAVEGVLPTYASEEGVVLRDLGLWDRFVIGTRACSWLAQLLLLPLWVAGDHTAHPFAQGDTSIGAGSWVLALVWMAVLALAFLRARRSRPFGIVTLVLLFAVSFLPVLQIIPIGALIAERFLYLPAFFFMAMVLPWLCKQRWFGFVAVAAIAITFTWQFRDRVVIYRDRGSFSEDILRRYPHDHRALNNLGVFHFLKLRPLEAGPPDYEAADLAFARALGERPRYRRGLLNRARARLARQENLKEPAATLDILESWLDPLVIRKDPDALYLLAKVSLRAGQAEADAVHARDHFELAIARNEAAAKLFLERQKRSAAASALKEAGLAASDLGDNDRQRKFWTQALELDLELGGADLMRKKLNSR